MKHKVYIIAIASTPDKDATFQIMSTKWNELTMISNWKSLKRTFVALTFSIALESQAIAQFSSIVDIPPTFPPDQLTSGTQINVLEGGAIRDDYTLGTYDGSLTNIELNVAGGTLGSRFTAYPGTTVNVFEDSTLDTFNARGAVVNVTGGLLQDRFRATDGAIVTISGGESRIGQFGREGSVEVSEAIVNISGGKFASLKVGHEDSDVNISGGDFNGRLNIFAGNVNLFGGEFSVDGVPVPGLETPGETAVVQLDAGSTLSATLADGNSFAVFSLPAWFGFFQFDNITSPITLTRTEIPPIDTNVIDVSEFSSTLSVRNGQVLNIGAGGNIADDTLTAAPGSTVNIQHGAIVSSVDAFAAQITQSSGDVDRIFANSNSFVKVTGGTIRAPIAATGSVIEIEQGNVTGNALAISDGQLTISGGSLNSIEVIDGIAEVSGGVVNSVFLERGRLGIKEGASIDGVVARSDSEVFLSGGSILGDLRMEPGSYLSIIANEILLDGNPIEGLTSGETHDITQPFSQLSGKLADGTLFSLDTTTPGRFRDSVLGDISPLAFVSVTIIPEPTSLNLILFVLIARFRIRSGLCNYSIN